MTLQELKSKAYDILAVIQQLQRELEIVNNEIIKQVGLDKQINDKKLQDEKDTKETESESKED